MTTSSNRIPISKLTITLLVTALCSQCPFIGGVMLLASIIKSSDSIPGNDPAGAALYGTLGLSFLIGGPVLLGLYFMPGRNGLVNGLRGFLATLGACIIYSFAVAIFQTTFNMFSWIIPSFSIAAILSGSGKVRSRREWIGLGLTMILGIGLSAILMNQTDIFVAFPVLYLWIWLSTVFVPEFICFRIDWRGLLIWLLFMIASPIIVYQIIHLFPPLQ